MPLQRELGEALRVSFWANVAGALGVALYRAFGAGHVDWTAVYVVLGLLAPFYTVVLWLPLAAVRAAAGRLPIRRPVASALAVALIFAFVAAWARAATAVDVAVREGPAVAYLSAAGVAALAAALLLRRDLVIERRDRDRAGA